MTDVRLIAHTVWFDKPDNGEYTAAEMTRNSLQEMIAYCARVSNPPNQNNSETAEKLLKYCINHKHWSVFEMANVVVEINTTRDISRQILRHSSLKPQEFSQRYANISEMGCSVREARLQDPKNRQKSIELDPEKQEHIQLDYDFREAQRDVWDTAISKYNQFIERGVAKEQCRVFLPEGMALTRLYLNGNVRDWFHFCQVRMDQSTQKECRLIAEQCWEILNELCPFLKEIEVE